MKVQIVFNQPEISGFLHINPANGDNPRYLPFANNECTEIVADNICDYVPYNQLTEYIQYLVSKIRRGGKLILGGTEVRELAKVLILNNNLDEFNKTLFGEPGNGWGYKSGATSILVVIDILTTLGMKITKKRLDNCHFMVEAIRD